MKFDWDCTFNYKFSPSCILKTHQIKIAKRSGMKSEIIKSTSYTQKNIVLYLDIFLFKENDLHATA